MGQNRLTKLLNYAKCNCNFYNLYSTENCDIADFPVLKKQCMVNNAKQFFPGKNRIRMQSDIVRTYTSGTTGIPINVYWNKNDYYRSMIELWRKRYEYYGITANSKKLSFNYKNSSGNVYFRSDYVLDINKQALYDATQFEYVYGLIVDFEPDWLFVKPHMFKMLLDNITAKKLTFPSSIRYIEFAGENIDPKEEERIRRQLKVSVANMYGSEEMNGIAYECPFHRMHIMQNNVFVEVQNIKDDSDITTYGEGRILVTNLNNYFMPMIRYDQGDFVSIETLKQPCQCGSEEPILSHIYGRENEIFYFEERPITSSLLSEIMNDINYSMNFPIVRYLFVYHPKNEILELILQVREDFHSWQEAISDRCGEDLRVKVGDIAVRIQFDSIEDHDAEKKKILKIVY